jgi:hypothetical protein
MTTTDVVSRIVFGLESLYRNHLSLGIFNSEVPGLPSLQFDQKLFKNYSRH